MSQNAPRLKKERMDLFFNKQGRKKSRADERKKSEFCRAFALHIKQKKEKREREMRRRETLRLLLRREEGSSLLKTTGRSTSSRILSGSRCCILRHFLLSRQREGAQALTRVLEVRTAASASRAVACGVCVRAGGRVPEEGEGAGREGVGAAAG